MAFLKLFAITLPILLALDGLWLGVQVETKLGDADAARQYALRLRKQYPDAPEVQRVQEMGL